MTDTLPVSSPESRHERLFRALCWFDDLLRIAVHVVWIVAGIVVVWATFELPAATAELAARLHVEYRATLAADRERLRAEFACEAAK